MNKTILAFFVLFAVELSAQTVPMPSYIKGVSVVSLPYQTIGVTDSSLWSYTVPISMYLRQLQIVAVTVEDTASFVLKSGSGFGTTVATVAVNAGSNTPNYWVPSGVAYQKINAGTPLRLQATLQDTLYAVSVNLLFTLEP